MELLQMTEQDASTQIGLGDDTQKSSGRNPYLFIVGCPRSGTTLLQRMLDNHPMLAIANDTHFIPRVVDPDGGDVALSPGLVDRAFDYHRFGRLGLDAPAVRRAASGTRTDAECV